ncbi:pyridoxal phosphate-dependent aminotransferase [Paractinoplanes globisporus]|uniref:Aminotransferase n=1 Tax=Paractinoplanes globisporus TaxID=113565 RepID=A0ABW6WIB5_9ACTN|nr:pyridoxal phosphate-dependent aminotransferase [Actinoplanes globisporus]
MAVFEPSDMTVLVDTNVRFDLAESTCLPVRMGELADPAELADVPLGYGTVRGDAGLRELIAGSTGVEPGQVLVTVGAIEAMFLLAQAVCGPGDRVLLLTPCFPPARTVPAGLGARIDTVPLSFDEGYRLPIERVTAALRPETRLVSLASPQNPSGVRFTDGELRALVDAVHDRAPGAVVLVDETYRESTYGKMAKPPSIATLAPSVITCSSVSKAHGAPGLRLGWLTTTDPALYDRLREAKFQTTISCSRVDEFLAARVLGRSGEILAARASFLEGALAELVRWAEKQRVEIVVPDGGPMCCLRLPASVDVAAFHRRLASLETRVAPGAWFGSEDRVVRAGFGHLGADDFRKALDHVADALAFASASASSASASSAFVSSARTSV